MKLKLNIIPSKQGEIGNTSNVLIDIHSVPNELLSDIQEKAYNLFDDEYALYFIAHQIIMKAVDDTRKDKA